MSGKKKIPQRQHDRVNYPLFAGSDLWFFFSFSYLRLFSETEFLRWTGYSPLL